MSKVLIVNVDLNVRRLLEMPRCTDVVMVDMICGLDYVLLNWFNVVLFLILEFFFELIFDGIVVINPILSGLIIKVQFSFLGNQVLDNLKDGVIVPHTVR